jgi:hypothetical protein
MEKTKRLQMKFFILEYEHSPRTCPPAMNLRKARMPAHRHHLTLHSYGTPSISTSPIQVCMPIRR